MARGKSRPARWRDAVDQLSQAVEELRGLQEEYQEWLDNLPESLQESTTADKLNEVTALDIDSLESYKDDIETAINEIETAAGEIEGVDLPLGFGRD